METLLYDLRYAVRMLLRSPGFTLAVVLTLAIGHGANVGIFTVMDAALFRPLPGVVEPQRLAYLGRTVAGVGLDTLSYPNYVDFRDQAHALSGVAASHEAALNVNRRGETFRVLGSIVTPDYFGVLGVGARAGRLLEPADDVEGAPAGAVISEALWRRFGQPRDLLGQTLVINAQPVTIVGIAGAGFQGVDLTQRIDIWLPLAHRWIAMPGFAPGGNAQRNQRWLDMQDRSANWLNCFARLRPGVDLAIADAEVRGIASRLAADYQDVLGRRFNVQLMPGIGREPEGRRQMQQASAVLLGGVGLLLLLACANIANLLLSRGVARRREIAVRQALGAPRRRLVRQLLTESILLALTGGLAGMVASVWISGAILQLLPNAPVVVTGGVPDGRVLLFAGGASLLAGVLFGLPAALQATSTKTLATIKSGSQQAGTRHSTLRVGLVVAQVALSVVLLAGAGLLIRTMRNFSGIALGFDATELNFMMVDPSLQRYDQERTQRFAADLLERLQALPGVRGATLGRVPPISSSGWGTGVRVGRADAKPESVQYNIVAPNYFAMMGIPTLRGTGFSPSPAAPVMVINETAAKAWFRDEEAVGRQVFLYSETTPRTIVGVVADSKYRRLLETPRPFAFFPANAAHPFPQAQLTLYLRSHLPIAVLREMVQREVRALDAGLPVYGARTFDEQMGISIWQQRLLARFVGAFAVLALLLGVVGVYAVLAYAVNERTHELGVRRVLGAQTRDVLRLVLVQGAAMAAVGAAIGTAGALAATSLLKSFLYGVLPADPATFAIVVLLIGTTALLASLLPARRAARVDPMVALRNE